MRRVGLVIVVAVGARAAHAQTSVTAMVGIGASQTGDNELEMSAALQIDGGYLARPGLMIGVHVAMLPVARIREVRDMSMYDEAWEYSIVPVQLGVVARVAASDRAWLAPWLGTQARVHRQIRHTRYNTEMPGDSFTDTTPAPWRIDLTPQLATGVSYGIDVWIRDEHRVSVFASAAYAWQRFRNTLAPDYFGIWLGVGYRR